MPKITIHRTFEECAPEIAAQIERKRASWTFRAASHIDFDDVKMEILEHIWKKWHLYDQKRELARWVSRVIKYQLINILRNIYQSSASPCGGCVFNRGGTNCSEYGQQGVECPLYAKWYKTKRHFHYAKLPLALDENLDSAQQQQDDSFDVEESAANLHPKILARLTPKEREIYNLLFIKGMSKEDVAEKLGLKTSEKKRVNGYKRIQKVRNIILRHAKNILAKDGV